jgi:protease II
VARDEAVSADGTHVPFVILRPPGVAADASLPTIMEGYGAYGVNNIEPWYNPPYLAWVAHGGAYAFCRPRCGNERGRRWHEDGRGAHKPNAHSDFIACAQRLEASGMTRADRLVAVGTSAGGLWFPRRCSNVPTCSPA